MAAKVFGESNNETIRELVPMLAGKMPDDYCLHVWERGFIVHKDADRTLCREIRDKEFRRVANFAQNHYLDATIEIIGDVPSVSLRLKD